jgi:dTMP kinase
MNGLFITFEGIDKSGKSTQAEMLSERLERLGHEVVLTLEPGGTPLGKKIRELVLGKEYDTADRTEVLLFAADRAQHIHEVILPALKVGKVVISDRFVDSTIAYQGYGRGMEFTRLNQVQEIATGGLRPDLTFWIDIELEISRERKLLDNPDRVETGGKPFYENVRRGYQTLYDSEPERIKRLDGTQSIPAIAQQILETVCNHKQIEVVECSEPGTTKGSRASNQG